MKKLIQYAIAFALLVGGLMTQVNAQESAIFYSNITPSAFGSTVFCTPNEAADDVPFFGTQRVTSFTYGIKNESPTNVTVRFYTVDAATGNPGALVAEFVDAVAATGNQTRTFQVPVEQQFAFTASPNLRGIAGNFGGYVSFQFESSSASVPCLREAGGTSTRGYFDRTQGIFITQTDVHGITPASIFLQLRGIGDDTANSTASVAAVSLNPTSIVGGETVEGLVTLNRPAPAGGTIVNLATSNRRIAEPYRTQIIVSAGSTSVPFTVFTGRVKRNATVTISATAGEATKQAQLEVRQ